MLLLWDFLPCALNMVLVFQANDASGRPVIVSSPGFINWDLVTPREVIHAWYLKE
jgi:hypothetical protein